MPAPADLVIANGAQTSNAIPVRGVAAISIQSPATLTGTITVQASNDRGTTFNDVYSDGAALTIAASRVVAILALPFDEIRLSSSAPEGGARTFLVGDVPRVSS